MTLAIGFDADSGTIVIGGNGVFPARSLIACASSTLPGYIQINDIAGRGEQHVAWSDVASLDGSFAPSGMADALAYLQGEFARRPAVPAGPRGPGIFSGSGDPDAAFGTAGDLYLNTETGDIFTKET